MNELMPILKQFISAPGISGFEQPIRRQVEAAWKPYADEITVSKVGSLHALLKGSGSAPRPRLLIAAHMDAIGLMVNRIVDGYLGFIAIGGIDPRILPGQLVTVHGKKDLPGVVVQPAARHLPAEEKENPVSIPHLWIDTGLTAEEVGPIVRIGDPVSFAQTPIQMGEDTLAGHSLDNRASLAALTVCMQAINRAKVKWDIWMSATVQEETRLLGGATSSYDLQPDLAIAVDVTFAKSPNSDDYRTFPLGGGVTLGWGANIHPAMYRQFKKLAEENDIPFDTEVMPGQSGTDSMAMQLTRSGVPNMVLSIPVRYMHSPVELAALKDIQRAGRLLALYIESLDEHTLKQITWEDEQS
jgi:endoglucanase